MLDNAGGITRNNWRNRTALRFTRAKVQKKSNGTWSPVEIVILGFLSAKEKPLTPRIH